MKSHNIIRSAVFAFILLTACLNGNMRAASFTVTNTNDSGIGSLRQAVIDANSAATDDVVDFAASLRGATITISSEILLDGRNGTLLINGLGADVLTIDGGPGDNRIFQQAGTVTIYGLTLQNGGGPGFNDIGAAVRGNFGTVTLDSIVVKNNQSNGNGVVFFQLGSGHIIRNSTISGNQAGLCAGLRIDRTSATIINTTISGNIAANSGGGACIFDASTVNIYNSTIAGNTAGPGSVGGGLYVAGGSGPSTVGFSNTIVAGNSAPTDADIELAFGSTVQTLGGNVIGSNASVSAPFPTGNPNGNLDKVGVSPLLGPLGNYGGTTPTRPLLIGSPALDAGLNLVQTPATDQRGAARSSGVDAGAFEANAAYSATLSPGTVTVAYNTVLVPNNNGFTYAQSGGTLPPGLNLTTAFAPDAVVALGGTPTLIGTYNFAVTATNGPNSFVTNYTLVIAAAPSAASVSVSGRVMTNDGMGLRNAVVVLTDSSGNSRSAVTSSFGYFSFNDLASGQTCVISVSSKRYSFSPQVLNLADDVADLVFTAQ